MGRIDTITDTEWSALHAHRDDVVDRCLNRPLDHEVIAEATRACYRHIGQAEPLVMWAPGPIAALAWSAALRSGGQLRGQLGGQLVEPLRVGLHAFNQLRGQLRGQLGGQLRGQLWDQLGDQLWDQLELRGQLRGQLEDQLWDQLGDQLGDAITSGWWVANLEHWLAINAHITHIAPADQDLIGKARDTVTMFTTPMSIPLTGVCIHVDHHTELHRDNQNRLHSTTGPAWAWADGCTIHALDGIRVPEWVITAPTPARILSDDLPNTEQRRVAMAHYGWDRAVHDLQLEVVDRADDPTWGTLYRLPDSVLDEPGQATLLVAENASPDRDGTTRTYGLLASGDARTVVEAQASLAQLSEAEWLALDGAS